MTKQELIEELCDQAQKESIPPKKRDILLKVYNLDLERFYYELAKWCIDDKKVFDDFKINPLPDPPEEMVEYYNLSPSDKRRMTSAFWEQEVVKNYLNRKESVLQLNRRQYDFAKELLAYIPEHDTHRISQLQDKINEMESKAEIGGLNVLLEEESVDLSSTPLDWV